MLGLYLPLLFSLLSTGALSAPAGFDQRALAVTAVSTATTASFKPFSFYAATGYCKPDETLTWSCGLNCDSNPNFQPTTSGGNGITSQFFFVGYDPDLDTVIVSHQGTDPDKIVPLIEDSDFFLESLDPDLFPGISDDVKVHNGFKDAQARSAQDVLAAVQQTLDDNGSSNVAVVGHSLGAAIALIDTMFLSMNLDSSVNVRHIGYGLPRTGNKAFADLVDSTLDSTHINNQKDFVPILPGRFLGFHHPSGEIHIREDGTWVSCAGQDNTDSRCTVGDVSNLLKGKLANHDGPYDGVTMGDSGCK